MFLEHTVQGQVVQGHLGLEASCSWNILFRDKLSKDIYILRHRVPGTSLFRDKLSKDIWVSVLRDQGHQGLGTLCSGTSEFRGTLPGTSGSLDIIILAQDIRVLRHHVPGTLWRGTLGSWSILFRDMRHLGNRDPGTSCPGTSGS